MLTLKLINEQTDKVIAGLNKKHFKGAEEAIKVIKASMKAYKEYRFGEFKAYKPAYKDGEAITENKEAEKVF